MIDIRSDSADPRAARLSNFTERHFVLDGMQCNSLEGFLQGLKVEDLETQKIICQLAGMEAKRTGKVLLHRDANFLYWEDDAVARDEVGYVELLTRAYDAAYEQDSTFREDLLATGHEELRHTVGQHDPLATVLTETEFLYQLYRLRARAHREPLAQTELPSVRS